MTPEQTRAAAEVMLAFADGKCIEWRQRCLEGWNSAEDCIDICWNWRGFNYRVKPGPFECWAVLEGDSVVLFCRSAKDAHEELDIRGDRVVRLVEAEQIAERKR